MSRTRISWYNTGGLNHVVVFLISTTFNASFFFLHLPDPLFIPYSGGHCFSPTKRKPVSLWLACCLGSLHELNACFPAFVCWTLCLKSLNKIRKDFALLILFIVSVCSISFVFCLCFFFSCVFLLCVFVSEGLVLGMLITRVASFKPTLTGALLNYESYNHLHISSFIHLVSVWISTSN